MSLATMYRAIGEEGGFTASLNGPSPRPHEHKFAVAFDKSTEEKYRLATFGVADLVGYIKRHAHLLRKPNVCLGAWVDDGMVYLDCTIVTDDELDAISIALAADQLAYFCFATMQSKNLNRVFA